MMVWEERAGSHLHSTSAQNTPQESNCSCGREGGGEGRKGKEEGGREGGEGRRGRERGREKGKREGEREGLENNTVCMTLEYTSYLYTLLQCVNIDQA